MIMLKYLTYQENNTNIHKDEQWVTDRNMHVFSSSPQNICFVRLWFMQYKMTALMNDEWDPRMNLAWPAYAVMTQ